MLYMAVTPDKYELPIAVADNRQILSDLTGVPVGIISTMISKHKPGTTIGVRFYRVEEIDDEEE